MKALSLWEPWASLMRCKAKKIETRGWSTSYRGPLLICAAKGGLPRGDLLDMLSLWEYQSGLAPLVGKPLTLPALSWPGVNVEHLLFGHAVCVVDLMDCRQTARLCFGEVSETELHFGDFTLGRYGWMTENCRPVKPFPVRGQQGLFEVPDELIELE